MSAASQNTDALFWLAYCNVIKSNIGNLGSNNAIFFGTQAQRGPPVGCAQEYQNYGIYQVANNLLSVDSLFYAPSATNTYLGALKSYLAYVDIGGNPSDAQKYAVMNAMQAEQTWKSKRDTELRAAAASYRSDQQLGVVPPNLSLIEWLQSNAPAYQNAEQSYQNASGQYKSAQLSLNGPLSGQWGIQMNRLNLADNTTSNLAKGLNMPVSGSPPPTISEVYNAAINNTPLPAPTDIYYVPLYSCPDYNTVASGWQSTATKPPKGANSHTLTLGKGQRVDMTSFGQTSFSGGLNFSFAGIIGFNAGVNGPKSETLTTNITDTNVTITMTWDDMQKVTVSPGNWNISNPRGDYVTDDGATSCK